MNPTPLEEAAINLHDFLWDNMGLGADWPVQLSGDDQASQHVVDLLNKLQEEIKASGFAMKVYYPRVP